MSLLQRAQRVNRPNYHKVQRFHVTFRGHLQPDMPADLGPISRMFYCWEIGDGGTPHTHLACEYASRVYSQPSIVRWLKEWLTHSPDVPEPLRVQEPDVKSHSHWEPMYGYHHGFSEKKPEPCTQVHWLIGASITPIEHAKTLLVKGKRTKSAPETALLNKMLLEGDLCSFVDEGLIPLKDILKYQQAKDLYNRLKKNHHHYVDWISTEKRRHLWVCDGPSTGKTTMCELLSHSASVYFKDLADSKFWEQYTGQQFVVLNDFSGSISVSALKSLTDGLSVLGVKGGSTSLYKNVVFIITSNHPMDSVFSKHFEERPVDREALSHRFRSINARELYNILHMSLDLIPCYKPCIYHPIDIDLQEQSPHDSIYQEIQFIKD